MTDPTPETAPRMHAAANESIEAMFKQGCAMEVDLHHARCATKRAARQTNLTNAERDAAVALLNEARQERDAMKRVLFRILNDIPLNRDWLDPELEQLAKPLVR